MSEHTSVRTFTQFRSLFCSLVFDPELSLFQVNSTKWISEVVAQEVGKTCDRVFSPLVTLALLLGQVLSAMIILAASPSSPDCWRGELHVACRSAHRTPARTARPVGDYLTRSCLG